MGMGRVVGRRALGTALTAAALAWGATNMPAEAARRLVEKDVNLDVAIRTAGALRGRGVDVVMTRDRDVFVELTDRTAVARRVGAEAFVSIHHNAGAPSRTGTEVYRQVAGDRRLADQVATAWHERLPGRGVVVVARANGRGGDYYAVLRTSPVPALIVEGGYLSNSADLRRLDDAAFRQAEADATAIGVLRWLGVTTAPAAPDLPPGTRQTVDALPAPASATAAVVGRGRVDLRWATSSLVEAYRVYRDGRLIGAVDNPTRTGATAGTATFSDVWASAGTTYRYELRAVAVKGDVAAESRPAALTASVPRARVVLDPGHGGHDPGAAGSL